MRFSMVKIQSFNPSPHSVCARMGIDNAAYVKRLHMVQGGMCLLDRIDCCDSFGKQVRFAGNLCTYALFAA
jgi:hypothetical protein